MILTLGLASAALIASGAFLDAALREGERAGWTLRLFSSPENSGAPHLMLLRLIAKKRFSATLLAGIGMVAALGAGFLLGRL